MFASISEWFTSCFCHGRKSHASRSNHGGKQGSFGNASFKSSLGPDDSSHYPLLWDKDLKSEESDIVHNCGSIAVVKANKILEDQGQIHVRDHGIYIGVYDGHGGYAASRFVCDNLFSKIDEFCEENGGISSESIRRAFKATDEEFLREVDNRLIESPKIIETGSCCLLGVISGNKLFVANSGDSRAVLGRITGETISAVRLSRDHNASDEEIRKELMEQHPEDSHIVSKKGEAWRVKGIIQVTKAIGDAYLKKPEISRISPLFQERSPGPLNRAVLTSEPSIKEHTVLMEDCFVIFASDGLWDNLSDEDAVNIVHMHPRRGIAKRLVTCALKRAAEKHEISYRVMKGLDSGKRRFFHDDITAIVMYLDPHLTADRLRPTPNDFTTFKDINAPTDIRSR